MGSASIYQQREAMKHAGWAALADETGSQQSRENGLLDVIRAHFERSLDAATRRGHPDFDTYARSWLAVNGDGVRESGIVASLRVDYQLTGPCGLRAGSSYWDRKLTRRKRRPGEY